MHDAKEESGLGTASQAKYLKPAYKIKLTKRMSKSKCSNGTAREWWEHFLWKKKLNEKSITQISESEQAGTYKSENLPDYIN